MGRDVLGGAWDVEQVGTCHEDEGMLDVLGSWMGVQGLSDLEEGPPAVCKEFLLLEGLPKRSEVLVSWTGVDRSTVGGGDDGGTYGGCGGELATARAVASVGTIMIGLGSRHDGCKSVNGLAKLVSKIGLRQWPGVSAAHQGRAVKGGGGE
ncbi:hypothetical protein L7F22_051513 [Adiantum nelumboides]|nr:hypothetical protein [Adiantum nelumboides]